MLEISEQILTRFWAKVEKGTGDSCWLWTAATSREGYGLFDVGHKQWRVHRLAYVLYYGPIPDGMCVCHNCDIKYPVGDRAYRACLRPDHLFIGTHQDNMADRNAKNRQAKGDRSGPRLYPYKYQGCGRRFLPQEVQGEHNNHAKLTAQQVREIRRLHGSLPYKIVAERYGVSVSLLEKINSGRLWRHLEQVA